MKPSKKLIQAMLAGGAYLALAGVAHASGTSMPWEGPLSTIQDSLTGPVASFIAVVAFLASGAVLAFGGGGDGMRKFIWAVFGVAIALGAAQVVTSLFGTSGGSMLAAVAPTALV